MIFTGAISLHFFHFHCNFSWLRDLSNLKILQNFWKSITFKKASLSFIVGMNFLSAKSKLVWDFFFSIKTRNPKETIYPELLSFSVITICQERYFYDFSLIFNEEKWKYNITCACFTNFNPNDWLDHNVLICGRISLFHTVSSFPGITKGTGKVILVLNHKNWFSKRKTQMTIFLNFYS